MKSTKLPFHPPFYYGWVILFIAALSMFFSGPGQTYSISIFIDYYIEDFDLSRSLVSTLYLFATLLSGFLLFTMGRAIERFGPRRMSVVIAVMLGLACLWNSFLTGAVMMFIGFFTLRFFGQGSMMLLPNTVVPQWFVKQRGRAYSIMGVGGFLGFLCMPPINQFMINAWGWPVAWRVWSILLIGLFVPMAYFLLRNTPEEVGLLPDSPSAHAKTKAQSTHTEPVHSEPSKPQEKSTYTEENWTFQEAIKTRAFWLFLFCAAIPAMVNTGIVFHLGSIFIESGLDKTTAALALSVMAFVSFPFSFVAGFLIERSRCIMLLQPCFSAKLLSCCCLSLPIPLPLPCCLLSCAASSRDLKGSALIWFGPIITAKKPSAASNRSCFPSW